jgi:hypothetical protein
MFLRQLTKKVPVLTFIEVSSNYPDAIEVIETDAKRGEFKVVDSKSPFYGQFLHKMDFRNKITYHYMNGKSLRGGVKND